MSLDTPGHLRDIVVSDLPPVDLVVDARQSTYSRVEVSQTSVPNCWFASASTPGTGFPTPPVTGEHRVCCGQPKKCSEYALSSGNGRPPAGEIADQLSENVYSCFWDVRHRRWKLCCRRRVQVPGNVAQVHDDGAVLVHVVAEVNSHWTPRAGRCPRPPDGSTCGQTRAIGRAQTKPLRKLPSAGGEMPGSVSAVAGPVQPCRVEGLPWENVRSAGRS